MYKSLLLILGVASCIVWPLLRKDDAGYAALVKSSEPKEMRAYCQQFREGVSKRLWADQICHIASDHSELFFFSHDGEIELIEEIDALSCVVQEECFFRKEEPMQLVRLLEAKEACFNYNTQLLTAHDVQMWTYELPGHTPPEHLDGKPVMEGKAEQVELQLKGNKVDMTALQFEGRML